MERTDQFDRFEQPDNQEPAGQGPAFPDVPAQQPVSADPAAQAGASFYGSAPEQAGQPGMPAQPQPVAPAFVAPSAGPSASNVRNQVPQRPESVDFTTMPQAKKSRTGLIVGVVAGCLLLVAGILAGAYALTGWIGQQFASKSDPSHSGDLFGDWGTYHDFDWNDIEGMSDEEFDKWLKEHGFDMDSYDNWFDTDSNSKASKDPAADDGYLHDARSENVSYQIKEETYSHIETKEHVDAYGMDMQLVFSVQYPQLEGDLEHKDQINELIRTTAMDFVTRAYLQPEQAFVDIVKNAHANEPTTDEEGMEHLNAQQDNPFLYEEKTYAITYNSDKLISIVFSDSYYVDDNAFLEAQELNINLETGEAYTFDDVLQVTDAAARHWAKNILDFLSPAEVVGSKDASSWSDQQGEDAIAKCLTGADSSSMHVDKGFFIDANGKVNLNVSWRGSNDNSQGWWDVTLTDDELAEAKKDSSLWSLL